VPCHTGAVRTGLAVSAVAWKPLLLAIVKPELPREEGLLCQSLLALMEELKVSTDEAGYLSALL